MGDLSTTLYVYMHEEGLSQLKRGWLPLTRHFPWLTPYTMGTPRAPVRQPISASELENQWRVEYAKLPAAIQALLSFADFKAQSDRLLPAIEKAIFAQREAPKETPAVYPRQSYESLSAWRLFPSALSHFAWSTLASDFSGLALALNVQSKSLLTTEKRLTLLRPVRYGPDHDVHRSAENPIPGFFNDAEENASLQEWRYVVFEKNQPPVTDVKITRDLIRSIYLGPLASRQLIEQVVALVRHDLRYRALDLWQVKVDEQRWRLMAEKFIE